MEKTHIKVTGSASFFALVWFVLGILLSIWMHSFCADSLGLSLEVSAVVMVLCIIVFNVSVLYRTFSKYTKEKIEQAEGKIQELAITNGVIDLELKQAKGEYERISLLLAPLQAEADAKDKLAKECERLRAESKRQLADMQTLKGELQTLKGELQTAQEGLADAHADMTDDRNKLANAKEELQTLKVNIANAESGKANAEKANSERLKALNERLQALAPYQQYYDLTAKDKGYKGIINSSSSTPEQKEKARGERDPIKARLTEIEATLNKKGASDE